MAAMNDLASPTGSSTRLSFTDRLKTKFLPAWRNMWADYKSQIIGIVGAKTGERLEGLKSVTVAGTGLIVSAGSRGQNQRVPSPTASDSEQLEIRERKYQATLEIQPELEATARGGVSSWEKAYAFELKALMTFVEIDKNDVAQIGRAQVLWRHSAAPAAATGLTPIQTITNRGSTAARFFDRGLMDARAGTQSAHPAYYRRRVTLIPSGNGALGSPNTGLTWPSGDRSTTDDNAASSEIMVGAMSGTPTAPTITYNRGTFGNAAGTNGTPATSLAGLTGVAEGWVVPYASRAPVISATAADAITQFYGTEGILSFTARQDLAYAAVLGAAKTSLAGLQSFYDASGGGGGADRPFSDGLLDMIMAQVMMIRDDGHLPSVALQTWPGWKRVSMQYDTYKRMDPVIGKAGTTAVGNKPEGFMVYAGAGSVIFKPRAMAMPKMCQILNPADWEKLPCQDWGLFDTLGETRDPDYDTTRYNFREMLNYWCKDPSAQAVIDDLSEDPFTPLT
jgi:hypothetical protein